MLNRIKSASCAAVVVGLLPAAMAFAQTSASASDQAACAAHDLRLVTQIEQLGEAGFDAGAIDSASTTMLQARTACRDGQFADGMKLYETIQLPARQ